MLTMEEMGNPLPICLFSMEGHKSTRLEGHLLNNVLTYNVHPPSGNADSCTFTDMQFEEGVWYHLAIVHYVVSSIASKVIVEPSYSL